MFRLFQSKKVTILQKKIEELELRERRLQQQSDFLQQELEIEKIPLPQELQKMGPPIWKEEEGDLPRPYGSRLSSASVRPLSVQRKRDRNRFLMTFVLLAVVLAWIYFRFW